LPRRPSPPAADAAGRRLEAVDAGTGAARVVARARLGWETPHGAPRSAAAQQVTWTRDGRSLVVDVRG
jgi:hypothetical protein